MASAGIHLDLRAVLQDLIDNDARFGTQDALATAIEISPSRLSRILKNPNSKDSLSVENCLKLAKVTGLSPDHILAAAGKSVISGLINELYGPQATTTAEVDPQGMSDKTRQAFNVLMESWARDAKRKKR